MSHKILVGILGLLSVLLMTQARAESPKSYSCTGNNVNLSYFPNGGPPATTSGATYLTLTIGKNTYRAGKANIQTSKSVFGTIKSITTKFLPDVAIYKSSFILPEINLGASPFPGPHIDQLNFKSQLVMTTIATPFTLPPFVGVVNASRYINLNCTASVFLPPLPL
ncbi:MAG: hypothetical protein ABL933_10635 [Methyloglobulus sp.]|nr:hypothetical protein [Methyloglobulus sp.]